MLITILTIVMIAVLLGGAVLFLVITGAVGGQAVKNAMSPIETKTAKVISKRNIMDNQPYLGSLLLFEFDDGSRQELSVKANAASTIAESDTGKLTYQGRKFIDFERDATK